MILLRNVILYYQCKILIIVAQILLLSVGSAPGSEEWYNERICLVALAAFVFL